MRGIFDLVLAHFSAAEKRAFTQIIHYLGMLEPGSREADEVANSLYNILRSQYSIELSSRDFKRMVESQTSTIYKELVKKGYGVPARTDFGLADGRAMQWLDESSLTFLGRYAASPELERRVKNYIRDKYLKDGTAVGKNTKGINSFIKEFGQELTDSKDRVRNIIDTTVSRARVFGQVNSLRSAGGKTFTIAGPDDNLTCEFCRDMMGRTFTVAAAVSRLDSITAAGAASVSDVSPFLKGNMDLADVQESSDEDLEAAGFALPPYHGSCRHSVVVETFYEDEEVPPYQVAG